MPNKCGVVNCKGNYDSSHKCRVFRLPKDNHEQQKWLNVLPPRDGFIIDPSKFFICEKHWPADTQMVNIPGGSTRPVSPPNIFDVPSSCLPSPKPAPRQPKVEDQQLNYFLKKDKISSFAVFCPDKELNKTYENVAISRTADTFVCIFMLSDFSESYLTIIVHNKSTLCSPLTFSAFKNGVSVPLGKIVSPNNGLSSYSQFMEAVRSARNYCIPVDVAVKKVTSSLQQIVEQLEIPSLNGNKIKKLKFLSRQLQLTYDKNFSVADYCFAVESYPQCSYSQLRDVLTLPSKRKMQSVISSTDIDQVLEKTFKKTRHALQKNCMLLVDEVKIRPTVSYSGGVLNGMSKNDPESKASSMLCVMLKCLHGGPSLMISVTPVHRLTASFQFTIVKEAATVVERSGGIVLGSITDNHKINQQYIKLFTQKSDSEAVHPLDDQRKWFLLFDSVHILKCIRNNWITEKCQKLSFDKKTVGSFSDIKTLYEAEKDSILKTTRLTSTAVNPSKLQLQNVKHVLSVFSDRVVAALKLQGSAETAEFVLFILNWWNTMNVSEKGQDIRMRDPNRAPQTAASTNLQYFLEQFKASESGHGPKRVQCLTHDTRKALVQTIQALISLCRHLFAIGFDYVLLRELQSDRIEGEFSVYRQSTGANAFMSVGDVNTAFKKRLTRFASSFLEHIDADMTSTNSHVCCNGIDFEDAAAIERCVSDVTLSDTEVNSAAYVAGWLEKKCQSDLSFSEDDEYVCSGAEKFIEEVSRGALKVPHVSTFELVRTGLCFVKHSKHTACCRQRLINVLCTISMFFDIGISSKHVFRRLANVLLHGLHNLEKDHQKNSALYQTSIKKARLAD